MTVKELQYIEDNESLLTVEISFPLNTLSVYWYKKLVFPTRESPVERQENFHYHSKVRIFLFMIYEPSYCNFPESR